ncbi:MAG TPA: antibiotic biosynthesis monooxygenase [Micromonosporaceae bacterium]
MGDAAAVGRLMTMTAQPGLGDRLAATMLRVADGLRGFPGCEVYLVGRDRADPDTVYVWEVWADEAASAAALRAAAGQDGSPADVLGMLAAPPRRVDVDPLGGVGLPA